MLQGGIITRRPLCYTADGRLVIAPCGSELRVFSARSGEHIATLRGHTAEVTAAVQDPSSKLLLSASRDGTVRQWDVYAGRCLQSWDVGALIESMVYSRTAGVAYLSTSHKGGQSGRVVPLLLGTGAVGDGKIKTSAPGPLVISPSGHYVAALDKHSCLVWPAAAAAGAGGGAAGRKPRPLNLPHSKPYTCVAFDPSDSTVALGDATGRILLWHNFDAALQARAPGAAAAAAQLPPCTTVHWHARPVGALCFSTDGAYLFSGGQEGVLVRWARANNSRSYLPRLGGAICCIATCEADAARLLLAHKDNSVRLINTAAWRVDVAVNGLRPPPPAAPLAAAGYGGCVSGGASSPAGVVQQPGTGAVVLPAEHASLQFFDMQRERQVSRLQVVPRNPLMTAHGPQTAGGAVVDAAAAADGSGLTPAVVLLAFTADAGGLVTVDVRPGTSALGCGATEATLRFWDAAAGGAVAGASQPYALNTTADAPHGTGLVSGLACHPSLPLAVTTGREGEFKVWARAGGAPRKAGGSGAAGASHWRCAAVGGYKGLPLTCCAFSQDGSLLAVGAGPSATLWDPTSTSLLSLLCCPAELLAAGHELRQLAFMRASPHLLAVYGGGDPSAAAAASAPGAGGGSDLQQQQQQQQGLGPRRRLLNGVRGCYGNALVVWNLLTQAVSWYASMPVCALAADPVHDVFAVGVPALMDAPRASTGGSNGGSSNGASGQQQAAAASPQQQAGSGAQQELAKQKPRQRQAAQQGLVLVFGPHSPDPLYACPVLGSNPSTLLFSPGSTQAAAAAAAAGGAEQPPAPPSVSPLLLLTDDRRYTRLVLAAAAAGGADAAAAAAAAGESSGVPAGAGAALEAEAAAAGSDGGASGLEAMFGKAAPAAVRGSGGGGSGCGDRDGAAEAAAIKAAVAQLFDAPSHVLPPPSALCPTLLELLTGAAAGARLQQQR